MVFELSVKNQFTGSKATTKKLKTDHFWIIFLFTN
jgi:hypothetical protein